MEVRKISTIRLSDAERRRLSVAATLAGKPCTTFIREVSLGAADRLIDSAQQTEEADDAR